MENLLLIADLGGAISWIGNRRIDWKRIRADCDYGETDGYFCSRSPLR